jgi:hypothetical protein
MRSTFPGLDLYKAKLETSQQQKNMTNIAPPDALKAIKPYLTLATQLDAKNDKVIAYYCKIL